MRTPPAEVHTHMHAAPCSRSPGVQSTLAPPASCVLRAVQTVAYLHKELQAAGFKAAALHGQRSQEEREAALRDFRAGKVQVLVATDVAARGLHVRQLPYIVNYDFPGNLDTYIHRIGRTGAACPRTLKSPAACGAGRLTWGTRCWPPACGAPASARLTCRSPGVLSLFASAARCRELRDLQRRCGVVLC